MARNGSGVYALPTGQPVVTGTTISSTTHNTLMSDIANALTTSIASDGQTAMGANLPMGGNKLTGLGAATVAGDALRYEQFTPFLRAALLGTASQSAGVPTGSVIERGSNANGDYVRFADGTQICNATLGTGFTVSAYSGVSALYYGAKSWTYPATFAGSPVVSGGGVDQGLQGWLSHTGGTVSAATIHYFTGSSSVTATFLSVSAVGRWF